MNMRLAIAGARSGVGKTTVTVGLIAALRRRGLTVQPFKVGPDYIDPTYHTLAAGCPCRNLDTWMVPPDRVCVLFAHAARQADVSIVEGVMGLYDGLGYEEEAGSTAQVAKLTQTPVILVLDASKMARSAAALALGYRHFDPDLPLVGFIVNRVGSERHGRGVATAIEQATDLPVLGWLPRDPALGIPERHLGLVPTAEPGQWQAFIDAAADCVDSHLDLDRLLALIRNVPPLAPMDMPDPSVRWQASTHDSCPVIAVAQDEAFHFTYPCNLDLLRVAGAEIAFFSPLQDTGLPPGTAGVLLSGGFPELHAEELSANEGMRRALCQAHEGGMPIYAECGGLMALTESIVDLNGREHPMFGLLPGRSVMAGNLTLGYRLARADGDSWLLSSGEVVRGHEFHYSAWEGRPADMPPAYHLLSRDGRRTLGKEGACLGSLWASYVHLHFWGQPELPLRFVQACAVYAERIGR